MHMAHGSAGQEVTLRHIRPQSHIVDQIVAEYYRGVNSSFCGFETQCFPGIVDTIIVHQTIIIAQSGDH